MADDDLQIKFSADASGITAGAAEAKEAVTGVGAPVDALAAQMAALTEAIAAMTAGMAAMGAETKKVEQELEEEEGVLAGIAGGIREFGEAGAETKGQIIGFGEAWLGFFAIEGIADWAQETAEAGEHAEQLGQKLGTTTGEIQQWQSVATLTGRSVDQFTTAFTRLTDNLVKGASGSKVQADAMKDLGLTAADAANPMQAVLEVADKFKEMHEAGQTAREIADAMALMGRAGADMIPILNLGSAGIEEMKDKGVELGAALTDGQNVAVIQAADVLNEMKLSLTGLSEGTFVQLIPAIELTAQTIGSLAQAILAAEQPMSGFRTVLSALTPVIVGVGVAMVASFAAGPITAGIAAVSGAVEAFGAQMALSTALAAMEATSLEGLNVALVSVAGGAATDAAAFGTFDAVVAALTIGIQTATGAVVEFGLALLANPVGLIAVAIGALAAGYVLLTQKTTEQKQAESDLNSASSSLAGTMDVLDTLTAQQVQHREQEARATLATAAAHLQAAEAAYQESLAQAQLLAGINGSEQGEQGVATASAQATAALVQQTKAVNDLLQQLHALENWKPPPPPELPKLGGDQKGESQIEQWTEKLHQQELQAAADTGDYMKDQTQNEINFWQAKLATTTEGSKAWYEVQDKIYSLMKTQQNAAYSALIAGDKEKIQSDRSNQTQWTADWDKMLADIAQAYGKDSSQYIDALAEKNKAETEFDKAIEAARIKTIEEQTKAAVKGYSDDAAQQKAALSEQIKNVEQAANDGVISRSAASARVRDLISEEAADAISAAQRIYTAQITADLAIVESAQATDQQRIAANDNALAAWTALQNAMVKAQQEASNQMDAQTDASAKRFQQSWNSAVNPIVSTFSKGFLQMAEGSKTFQQVVLGVGNQILNNFVSQVIDKMVERWLWGVAQQIAASTSGQAILTALGLGDVAKTVAAEAAKTAAAATGNAARATAATTAAAAGNTAQIAADKILVASDAGVAFSGTFAALASNPVTLASAPGAAAAAYSEVMSVGLASAAGGFDIPAGIDPLTQLHEQEMVLPASLANPIRAMAAGYDPSSAPSDAQLGAQGGGDIHHHWTINAMDAKGVKDVLMEHGPTLVKSINRQTRNGAKVAA